MFYQPASWLPGDKLRDEPCWWSVPWITEGGPRVPWGARLRSCCNCWSVSLISRSSFTLFKFSISHYHPHLCLGVLGGVRSRLHPELIRYIFRDWRHFCPTWSLWGKICSWSRGGVEVMTNVIMKDDCKVYPKNGWIQTVQEGRSLMQIVVFRYLSAGGSCVRGSSWKIEELQYMIQYYTQDRMFRVELWF